MTSVSGPWPPTACSVPATLRCEKTTLSSRSRTSDPGFAAEDKAQLRIARRHKRSTGDGRGGELGRRHFSGRLRLRIHDLLLRRTRRKYRFAGRDRCRRHRTGDWRGRHLLARHRIDQFLCAFAQRREIVGQQDVGQTGQRQKNETGENHLPVAVRLAAGIAVRRVSDTPDRPPGSEQAIELAPSAGSGSICSMRAQLRTKRRTKSGRASLASRRPERFDLTRTS